MTDRRSLLEGIEPTPNPPSNPPTTTPSNESEKSFVYGKDRPASPEATVRTLVSTRIRGDYARLLKRASLERQLDGTTPNTLQDILEEAIRPWLKKNGYL